MSPPALSRFMNGFLTKSEVKMGRLVLDTADPQKNFCKATSLELTAADHSRREFDNINNLVGAVADSKFQLLFTKLLDVLARKSAKSNNDLKTSKAIHYELYNVDEKLEILLQDEKVRLWLEKYRSKRQIYLIVALYTVENASVKLDAQKATEVDVKAKAPVKEAANAVAPGAGALAGPAGANLGVDVAHSSSQEQSASFVAPGERIIAVGYQAVQFQAFSSVTADATRLAKKTVWKSFDTSRASASADMIEAMIGDNPVENLKGLRAKVEADHTGPTGKFVILEDQVNG